MQTLITGTPGAGKTLHAIEKLLLPLVGKTVKRTLDDGTVEEVPRRIFTNIKGLLIEHELVEAGPFWEFKGREWQQPEGNRLGWHNWHEWAPAGAVLVVDEFQKVWPPRANGAPVPPDVQAMDTHRHMGVDFILISQSPNNFDRHIAGLAGRHLHVRRIANFPAAVVYEWDHCSRSLMFSKAISKAPWRYSRKVFKLYHSADLHTKSPRKVPTLLYVVLGAAALGAWKIPESYGRIMGKTEQQALRTAKASSKPAVASASSALAHAGQGGAVVPGPMAVSEVGSPAPGAMKEPAPAGCIASASKCWCFDAAGARMEMEYAVCRDKAAESASYLASYPPPVAAAKPAAPAASGVKVVDLNF